MEGVTELLKVLIVEDDFHDQTVIRMSFPDVWTPAMCSTGLRALDLLQSGTFDLILLDLVLPDMDGISLLEKVRSCPNAPPAVIISDRSDSTIISRALKAGAADFLQKPFSSKNLKTCLSAVIKPGKRKERTEENVMENPVFSCFIGRSKAIELVKKQITSYSTSDAPILLTGESGTGKEIAVKIIHSLSPVNAGPLIPINCGAIPETLFETEFFGSEKGAFTDAVSRAGAFERAEGGTIFLDEIGEMGRAMQVKLLRVLEQKEVSRVGGDRIRPVNVRVISASNADLRKAIELREFREDLYHRISVLHIVIPPLRNRQEDIPLLAEHFLCKSWTKVFPKRPCPELTRPVRWKLMEYNWPGNIRELKNVIERAVLLSGFETIEPEMIQFS